MQVYASYLLFQFWSHTHLFDDSTIPASDKLPKTTSARSVLSRVQTLDGTPQVNPSPLDRIRSKTPSLSFRSPDISRSGTPLGRRPSLRSQKSRTSSEDDSDISLRVKGHLARNVDAFLISPYASTSQVTVSVSDVPHTAPVQGSTVRLVDNSAPAVQDVRHRRTTSTSVDSIANWNGSPPRDGRVSPVDEVIAAYLTNSGTEEAAKVRRRMHQIVQSSEPYEEKPREPEMSWTLTLVLLAFVTVVSNFIHELTIYVCLLTYSSSWLSMLSGWSIPWTICHRSLARSGLD